MDLFSDNVEAAPKVYTVGSLTRDIQQRLESGFKRITVEGEISQWTAAASGHVYLTLKDSNATLSAVIWRTTRQRMAGTFGVGDQVRVVGSITVYPPRGAYQLTIDKIEAAGAGQLWQRYLQLKEKLEKEGLFDAERKRPLPTLPRAIGIVTSPQAAALRDMLSVLERRAPQLRVFLYPARVQGAGAAGEVAQGLRALANSDWVDVVIVGRGGGSIEDLWEFNNEALAREIAASPVPVISAVGHETDFSISDFVADLRAATPTEAAEKVCAEAGAILARVEETILRLDRAARENVSRTRNRVHALLASYSLRSPEVRLREDQQRVDDALRRADEAINGRIREMKLRARGAGSALLGHDPGLILKKGYAIIRDPSTSEVLTSAAEIEKRAAIEGELRDGRFTAVVDKVERA